MKTSELFAAGGAGLPYQSNLPHWWTLPNSLVGTSAGGNADLLQPFIPRADVTIDHVNWLRANTTAANVYLGIYDKDGTLLTDCAVDSDTTATQHEVSTTAVNLIGGNQYFWCLNQSTSVAASDVVAATDPENAMFLGFQPNLGSMGTLPGNGYRTGGLYDNARTNAALLSSITLSDFDEYNRVIAAGVTPQ